MQPTMASAVGVFSEWCALVSVALGILAFVGSGGVNFCGCGGVNLCVCVLSFAK